MKIILLEKKNSDKQTSSNMNSYDKFIVKSTKIYFKVLLIFEFKKKRKEKFNLG